LILLGALGTLVAGVLCFVQRRAVGILERHEREFVAKVAAIRGRDWRRPSLYSDSLPSNAWDFYGPALLAIKNIPTSETMFIPELAEEWVDGERPNDDEIALFYDQHKSEIEDLRKGLRSSVVDPGVPYEQGYQRQLYYFSDVRRAGSFLSGAIQHSIRIENHAQALELAIISLGMAQDASRGGGSIDESVRWFVAQQIAAAFRRFYSGYSVRASAFETFAKRLDHLERISPPIRQIVEVDELEIKSALLHADWSLFKETGYFSVGPGPQPLRPTWRALFSERLTRVQALDYLSAYTRDLEEVYRRPPYERSAAAEKIDGRYNKIPNPLTYYQFPSYGRFFKLQAEAALHLTMLRVATALAWYESEHEAPPAALGELVPRYLLNVPLCPYTGTPLRYTPGKVWSIGGDRKDNGGVCDEKWANDVDHEANDVVWYVWRKK
jgi:hypothetical protein